MKTLKNIVLIVSLSLGFTVYGQDNCSEKQLIAKIDSISTAKSAETGGVYILYVTNTFDKTATRPQRLTKDGKFHFDGSFLVIDDKYFNINKLLYFYINDDVVEFFFQGY